MRSDVDFSTPPDQGFRRSRPWFWRWMLGGIVAVIALAIAEAPVWAFALVLMAWCAAGLMWLRSDALAAARQMNAERANSEALVQPPPPETPNWHNWISGWYWETNAQHQLQVFKPGTNLLPQVSVDWSHLSEYVESGPAWLSNWSEDGSADLSAGSAARLALESDLGRLSYCFAQKVASGETLNLPWPDKLQGLSVAACEGWRCLVQCEPRWDGQGQFLGFRGVMQMVAPAKNEAQVEAEAALSKAAAEAAVQNAQMSEAEQEVLRYALSHDLRAPLRVVEGFTRIVKEDYGRAMDRLGNDHLDRVLTAAARMNGMIDAILAQAQLAAEPLQRVDIDLTAMAREIAVEQLAASPCGAAAQVSVADGLRIEADPLLVRRVLENLIGNALKYSAKVEASKVEVGAMPATNPAVFFVRDNGAGFDMQHADKLFGMFQRLHSAKEFPGTGVGLAGVQNIVRRHGGRIWAEARPGEGACFYFTLMGTVEAQQRAAKSAD
jgi:signal transduction histidine kinase